MSQTSSLSVGVDVGGTFTDLVAVDAEGRITTQKVPSTPADQSEGVARALGLLGAANVIRFVHGTTIAANALLERSGSRVVLVATEGFTDVLHLARQDRASLYDLARHHPAPLVRREDTVGVRERMVPEGVHVALSDEALGAAVERVRKLAPDVVVVALLHAYADATHEQRVGEALRKALPAAEVVLASDVFPEIREYERTATSVAEGYLRPAVSRYLTKLTERARDVGVPAPGVMTSGGGMRTVGEAARNAASLALSGPAGGVRGAAAGVKAAGVTPPPAGGTPGESGADGAPPCGG